MELKKETVRQLRGLVVFTVLVLVLAWNYGILLYICGRTLAILFPFLLGGAMAFVLNVPMRGIEDLMRFKRAERVKRPLSLILAVFLVTGVLLVVMVVVVPEFLETIATLQSSIPAFFRMLQREGNRLFASNPEVIDWMNQFQINWEGFLQGLFDFLTKGAGSVLSSTWSAAMSIVSGVTSFGIAFIFAMYLLLQKETLLRQTMKLCRALFPDRATERIFYVASISQRIFSSFLAGQCVEAVILGTMFFVAMTLLSMPYALLIGVLIAFTALIPVFGAFIGCAVGAFLTLMVSPMSALAFVILFFVLQQIEGNLIYPHVVGNSVGLPAIWVLAAVTIGGNAFGIVGMLVFIPLCSVIYRLLREWMYGRLEQKDGRALVPCGPASAAKGKDKKS